MVLLLRYTLGDWLQVLQLVVIVFVDLPFSGYVVSEAGFCRAGNGGGPYGIQWLKRLKPALFRQDLIALFDLLHQQKIKPMIAPRFPLAEARQAQELLGQGGVTGKIVLVRNGSEITGNF